jgi:hypothetical protein
MAPSRAIVTRKVPPKSAPKSVVTGKLDGDSLPDRGQIIEKDETEERLEKLIFGDEAGCLASLKPDHTGRELLRNSDSSEEEENSEGDEDLAGVADEDVWSALTLRN